MTIEIPLSRGLTSVIDDEDAALLARGRWHAGGTGAHIYARRSRQAGGVRFVEFMHRLIMEAPTHLQVDHINGDTLDNRRANLRLCTQRENLQSRRAASTNRLGVKGVWEEWGKFRAGIAIDGRTVMLGSFATVDEAKACYDAAAKRAFGDFFTA